MKKILLLIICCLGLVSCERENIIFANTNYVVAKVNDSIVAVIPSQYGSKEDGVKFVNIKYINNENFSVVKK
jgi:hypothetical protein